MQLPESQQEKTNRRGCSLLMIGIPLVILLLVAIGMGWLGTVDRGKISDLPIMGNSS